MVLAMWWLKKLKRESEEKQAEARREGHREECQRWEAWARQVVADARAAGISITEPPPFDEE